MDSLVIIPNERLKFATDQKITFANAFEIADDVLRQAVQSISDLIRDTGFINLDFADVTAIMKDAGMAHMGVGRAAGKGKAEEAATYGHLQPPAGDLYQGCPGRAHQHHRLHGYRPGGGGTGRHRWCSRRCIPTRSPSSAPPSTTSLDDEIRVTVIATGFAEGQQAKTAEAEKTPAGQPVKLDPLPAEGEKADDDMDKSFNDILKIFQKDNY